MTFASLAFLRYFLLLIIYLNHNHRHPKHIHSPSDFDILLRFADNTIVLNTNNFILGF